MNDLDLANVVRSGLTDARDSLTTVHMTVPASNIMARADQARRHRRLGVLAGAGGLAAAAVAVSVALPASHHQAAGHSKPAARLAAWTVTRLADGRIQVTFREATDPAGLQSTLRADAVPASVTFTGQQNPACRSVSFQAPPFSDKGAFRGPLTKVLGFGGPPNAAYGYPRDVLVIYPPALPHGYGIQIWTSGSPGAADSFQLHADLVKTSPQCTGS
jgi:hypothetical protein